jgi:hypothetical protein
MPVRFGELNFSKGEIAEELVARIDVPSYSAALKQAKNVIVQKYGGVSKRPGTRLVAPAYNQTDAVRLLPFQFSLTQAYALEFGQGYIRAAANGGLAINAQATVAFHGYSVGQQVYFNDVAGMSQINGRIGTVQTVIDANNFTVDIDSRDFSAFTGDAGGITNAGAPPPPPVVAPPAPPPAPPSPPATGGGGSYFGGGDDGSGIIARKIGEDIP